MLIKTFPGNYSAQNFGAASGTAVFQAVATDAAGNVYAAGYFSSSSTLALGSVTLTRIGTQDAIVVKLSPTGTLLWAKNLGGNGATVYAGGIAVDSAGKVYLGGYFSGGNLTAPALTMTGTQDAFAVKLDATGAITWTKGFGGSGAKATSNGMAVDSAGNAYLAGFFSGANLTTPSLTKIGTQDSFAVKLDSTGATTWAKNFGGSGASVFDSVFTNNTVAVDSAGNVYLSGYFSGANFTTPALTLIGSEDTFALKLDSTGAVTWAKNFGGSGVVTTRSSDIAVDGSGNVYLAGDFQSGNMTTPALTRIGLHDGFALKLDSTGAITWAENFGGATEAGLTCGGIAVDSSDNVYLSGYFGGGMSTPVLWDLRSEGIFALKLNAAGTITWAHNFTASGGNALSSGIAVDGSGNAYLVGDLSGGNLTAPVATRIGTVDALLLKASFPIVSSISPGSGPTAGGTSVTITGINLGNATAVKFGSTSAKVNANTSTQITATSPSGSVGVADISIIAGAATSDTSSSDQFTYVPAPAIASVSPTSGSLAGGSSVTITGTNLSGATAVNFGSTAATSFTVNSATQITATSPAGTAAGAVDVTVTTPGGTSATGSSDQLTYVASSTAPTITTPTSASVTGTGATLGGNVTADGGATITERGVVYAITSTNSNPQIGGTGVTKLADSSATTGVFTDAVTGLTAGTGYTFSAYATNSVGTAYTSTGTFTTLNNNAALSGLELSVGTLSPSFAGGTTSYTASVGNGTTNLTVTGTTADSNATMKVNGTTVTSGTASGAITLAVGSNTITTVVTAQDGTTSNTYTITVTRAAAAASNNAALSGLALSVGTLSPSFTRGTTGYTASVPNGTTSLTVTPTTADSNATVKINGTSVTSGSASSAITLNVGSNTITTVVTAQDGTTTNTYTVTVTRAAALPMVTGVSPTSGSSGGGTSVTITGTNLSSATTVNFGSASATINSNTATQITATSPAGTGTVDITVTTSGGTSATSANDQFRYVAGPDFVGTSTALTVNVNSSAVDVRGLLHVSESAAGNTLTWSQSSAPSHGTLTVTGATASSGSTSITPGGTITYTPAANFSGTDSFTVQVSDGTNSATRTINVTFLGQGSASSQFVAVGDSGTLLTSTDAATWTARTSGTTLRLRGAAASGNLIVVVGQSGTVLTSPDGVTWTSQTSSATETLRGVTASPTRFVAVGGDTASLIRYSDDGVNWSGPTVSNVGKLRAVAWGSTQFVAVGAAGAVLTSPDGVTWTQQNCGTTDDLQGAVWTGSKFTVLSSTGKVLTSTDGVSWSSAQALPPSWIEGLTWSNTQFVTVGASGKVKNSPDGSTWTWQTSGTANTLHGVTWTGVFVAQTVDPVALTDNLRKITISGVAAVDKVYDATVNAVLNVASAVLSGVNSADTVTLSTSSAAGTFADKTVATGKTVTTSGFSISGTNAGDYTLVQPTATANITAARLTITGVTASNKTYDRTTVATLVTTGAALSGVVTGDTVNLSAATSTGAFADMTVANGKPVATSGFVISGADAANYSLTQPTTTASITAAPLTVTGVSASNKIYDGTTAATLAGTAALNGVISGDTVTVGTSGASAVFGDPNVGSGKAVTASGFSLGGTDAGNYILTQPTGITASITAKALTVSGLSASNKVYDGTTAATITGTGSLVGVVSGDTVMLGGTASGAFGDKTAATGKTVTISGLTLGGGSAGNYLLTQPTTTANITTKTLTVTGVTANNKVYDGGTVATLGTGSAALSAVVPGDTVNLGTGSASGAFSSKTVGTGKTVTVSGLTISGADAGNYALTQPTATANITTATLNVTGVTANNKVYDGGTTAALVTTSAALRGVLSGDSVSLGASGANGTFSDKTVGTGKTVTVSGLVISGTDAGNYALTQPTTTASITVKTLTVTGVTASNKTYNATTTATLSTTSAALNGVVSGDNVTLGTSSASGLFADANVGTSKTVAVSGLAISGSDAGNYALTQPTTTATITAKALTITGVTANNKTYDATTTATLSGTAALLTTESPGSGTTSDGAPYTGDSVTLGGTVTATFASKDVTSNLAVTVSGYTLSGAQATNYSATQPTGLTANITVKTLTVTGVTAGDKVYDATPTATLGGTAALQTAEAAGAGTTADGKPYTGDGVTLGGTLSGAFSDKNAASNKTVTVTGITLSGAQAGDYVVGGLTATANITAKALTISGLAASNKIYDGTTTAALTGTAVLANAEAIGTGTTSDGAPYTGDAVSLGGTASGTFASKDVANGIGVTVSGITLSGAQASNYSPTQPAGLTAAITAKALTASGLAAANKVYDATTTAALTGTAALQTAETAGTGTTSDGAPYTGDTVTLSGTPSGAFAGKDVGNGIAVTVSGLSLTGAQAGDYSLTAPAGLDGNITAKQVTLVGFTAVNKVYDATTVAALSGAGTLPAAEAPGAGTTSDGKPYTGDTVSVSGAPSGVFASKNAASGIAVNVSGLSLTGAQAGNYSPVAPAGLSANITAKRLTISGLTATNKTYDATTTATLSGTAALLAAETAGSGTASDGKPYTGDTVSLGGTAAGAFANKNIGSALAVTVSGLTLSGAQAVNYSVTPPVGLTATVSAKGLTVSGITANNKTYDGSTSATINLGGAALVGIAGTDSLTLVTTSAAASFANASAGNNKAVTISGVAIGGADAGNYTLTQPTATANIGQAGVTITLSNLNQTYDGSPKSVGVSVSPNVSTSTTYGGSATAPTDAGSYSVSVSVTDSNYSGSTSGTLTIAQASQTISFSLGSATIGSSVPLSATASSGLPVTFSVVSGSGAISPSTGSGPGGSSLTINGSGSITVRASQSGNANYLPASTDATISGIAKLDQTITFGTLADKRANDAAFGLSATASSGLPVTFTVAGGPALLGGNTVTLTGAPGSVKIRASQAGNDIYNAAPDVTQTFNVVAISPFIYFGSVGGNGMAAQINADGKSGTMIGTLPGTGEGFVVNFDPNATGDFVATVTTFGGTSAAATSAVITMDEAGTANVRRADLSAPATPSDPATADAAGTTRTFRGHVSGGTLTGSVDGLNAGFSANLVPATGPTAAIAGYYQSSSLNTETGSIYSIVGTTNQVYVLAVTPGYVGGNTGTATSSGAFDVQAAGQATITGAVNAPTTSITGTLSLPNAPAQNFAGLAVTTLRTDRLINLSSRAQVTNGANVLVAGFVIGGSTPKSVLLRGVGPGLTGFNIPGALAKPMLQLYDSTGQLLLTNSGWGGDATLSATMNRVGAFPLSTTSADAAMTTTLAPGAYTMIITNAGTDAGGIALAEIYDASLNPSADYQRLMNISTRGTVAAGNGVLVGGFVVTGNAPKKLLIRGIGPALSAFGVPGALVDPQLQVFDSSATVLARNDNWETPQTLSGAQTPATAADLVAAASATGAFPLTSGTKDAALIVTLAPGQYTAQVAGVNGATGIALVEIYEVPTN